MNSRNTSRDLLAIEGGTPVRTAALPPWPVFDDEMIEAAANVLRSGKVNYHTGREGRLFEEEFAETVGCRHAVAVANGSVALELALAALDVGPGDEVIVTSRSFIASASCCTIRGAVPVFADVDSVSQNVTAETIKAVLSPRSKAVVAVHLAGWPCEMGPIMHFAAEHGLYVIEDCAQAHGATYRGRPVGSLSHVAAFSFCQDKILTTGGEGGMLTTNDRAIWERLWSLKDHGKNREAVYRQDDSSVFRWLHESFGTNARMTEMQAAIGRVMLRNLSDWVATRRQHAAILDDRLSRIPQLRVAIPPKHIRHAYYRYYAFLRSPLLHAGWSRDRVVRAIQAEGIPCGSGACSEIYREKAFEESRLRPTQRLSTAQELGKTSLMLHVHPTLGRQDVIDTCRAVEKVIRAATTGAPAPAARAA
ncbi:MAG: DegT/DnrJ/EryC1/StrS aminotransferase family protein [Pirellulales bacterium]|nr:DegT/DnrJ/EryC1/StrS aminotransferase family protein [Pirellulales bacterium]